MQWYKKPLLCISFSIYFISILYSAIRSREKFDIFIGVACFSAFVGIFLKRLKIIRKLIYYSIDYYPKPLKFGFNSLIVSSFRVIDKLCVKNADLIWHISPRIAEARYEFAKISSESYRHITAPLTYPAKFQRFKPSEEIERYTIGFIGTLSGNQGLQLLIKAMPKIIKVLPQVKVRIIGKGPYENELKKQLNRSSLDNYFIFHGFIKDNEEVLRVLSNCAIGIAPWTQEDDNYVMYADPGKPKLYAFCGLPIIITNVTSVAKEIDERKAGITINYDENELAEAIIKLLRDGDKLKEYKKNAFEFAREYTTEKIFDLILQRTLKDLN